MAKLKLTNLIALKRYRAALYTLHLQRFSEDGHLVLITLGYRLIECLF